MDVMTGERPPAEVYDEKFVPALFGQWGPVVAAAASVAPGQTVLDVACGTGALTLAAADIVGPSGKVVGLDANPEMLAVALRKPGSIEWREGTAENLPFDDASFDAVVSQFGFMFFDDRPRALSEMMRVLKPGGRLAVAVCGAVERSPGYGVFALLLDRLFGEDVGNAFRAPFVLGDPEMLTAIASEADIKGATVEERNGTVRFKNIAEMVTTERACVWTLGGILDKDQFDLLLREAEEVLRPYADGDGFVSFDMPAVILIARKEN
jgi:SAM-dependent methyltransferase